MDNFMDKLAVKYTASEMIKANAQAEMVEMQGLQEQVEAYEAVLQEMRKLNYKNTELTEKMYSLVDESIEKVRTLQIEASENGANTELISKEMSDAVVGALNEAISNMDATVAKAVAESLQNALPQQAPVDNTEVLNSISALSLAQEANSAMLSSMTNKLTETLSNSSSEPIDTSAFTASVNESLESTNALVLEIKAAVERLDASISTNDSLSNEYIERVGAEVAGTKDSLVAITSEVAGTKDSLVAITSEVAGTKENIVATIEKLDNISARLEAIANANANVNEASSSNDEMTEKIGALSANVSEKINVISSKLDTNDTYVKGIWESVETTKNAVAALSEKPAGRESDEVRTAVTEILSGVEDVRVNLRTLKSSQDESKTSLKTSLDSAIYGLKQDNREVIEFIQRMNTNLMSITNDPDKERKEEEAREKSEEQKRFIEERLKSNEDFIHKESVKVYRNVQAVLNERTDRQSESLETQIKRTGAQVSQLKLFVLVAAVLSGADLIVSLLKIFGVL